MQGTADMDSKAVSNSLPDSLLPVITITPIFIDSANDGQRHTAVMKR